MAGVFRPYTLVDVLGTINQTQSPTGQGSVTGVGLFTEADETLTLADTATTTVQILPGWDAGVWGGLSWT